MTIEYPAGAKVSMFEVTATAPGHVPIFIRWDRFGKPATIPAIKELRFEPGTAIGGIVKDEAGKPIAGATIYRYSPPTEYEGARVVFMLKGPTTDGQGRWRMDDAPANLADADYRGRPSGLSERQWSGISQPRQRDRPQEGVPREGPGRRPRRPARAGCQGGDRSELCGWQAAWRRRRTRGASSSWRSAPRARPSSRSRPRDLRPNSATSGSASGLEPLAFRLQPASALRLRVVDVQGKPVAGAFVFAQTLARVSLDRSCARRRTRRAASRGTAHRKTPCSTTSASRVSWHAERCRLIASEREQVVTLHPKLVITGRVTDAETGQALPKCVIIEGVGFEGHRSDLLVSQAGDGCVRRGVHRLLQRTERHHVRSGRGPRLQTGRVACLPPRRRATDSSTSPWNAPRRSPGSSSFRTVSRPKASTSSSRPRPTRSCSKEAASRAGRAPLDRRPGSDGRFAFTAPKDQFLLIALGDAGYADASSEDFAKSDKLILQPWGRLEGDVDRRSSAEGE